MGMIDKGNGVVGFVTETAWGYYLRTYQGIPDWTQDAEGHWLASLSGSPSYTDDSLQPIYNTFPVPDQVVGNTDTVWFYTPLNVTTVITGNPCPTIRRVLDSAFEYIHISTQETTQDYQRTLRPEVGAAVIPMITAAVGILGLLTIFNSAGGKYGE